MKLKIYSLILFLNYYLTGLITPVLSLLLLDKGATIFNLSILLGIYALTVVVLEVPTGIIADVFGRKKTFCFSLIMSALSFFVILVGKGFIFLCFGMIIYGFSRALASGSFDAIFIDYYIDNFGKDKLHNITSRLAVLEALGLSAGALSGGVFPKISSTYFLSIGSYDLNVIMRIILAIVVTILSVTFIQDTGSAENKERISIKQHIKNSSAIISKNNTIICIFISVFSTGFLLSSLETYWQPHFMTLLSRNDSTELLGVMAFLYFAAATLGSISSNKLIKKYKFNPNRMYIIFRILMAVSLILTALQSSVPVFIVLYSSIYLLFGIATVPEGVILNSEIPKEIRASVLSVNSLAIQVGGLSGSFMYSILIRYISIPSIWILAASVVLLAVAIIAKKLLIKPALYVPEN